MIKLKGNQGAGVSQSNTFVVTKSDTGCCGTANILKAKYSFTYATSAVLQSIRYTDPVLGTAVDVAIPAGASKRKIEDTLRLALTHYDMYTPTNVRLKTVGSNYVLELFGEAVFVSVITSASTVAATRTTTQVSFCNFSVSTPGASALAAILNGVSVPIGAFTYGTQTLSQLNTGLASAFTTFVVTAIIDPNNAQWIITASMNVTNVLTIDGKIPTRTKCLTDFV